MKKLLKKIKTGMVIAISLLGAGTSYAGPIGNPTAQMPSQKMALGPQLDVFSQDFESNGVRVTGSGNRLLMNVRYGMNRNVELLSNIGFSKEDISFVGVDYSGNYGMAFELGAKMTFLELKQNYSKLGGGAKILLARSSIDIAPGQSFDADWREFGIFGGFSFETQSDMIPYFGLQLTKTSNQLRDLPGQPADFDQKTMGGIFGGVDFKLWKSTSTNLEIRLINEISATLTLSIPL
ncbi:MAG TPA: hypothetical protein VN944_09805 [Nitrospiria bacterium]|nr:hypothetical protein [Nitrospiria bacterium]